MISSTFGAPLGGTIRARPVGLRTLRRALDLAAELLRRRRDPLAVDRRRRARRARLAVDRLCWRSRCGDEPESHCQSHQSNVHVPILLIIR